jgi:hypothetical protein
VRWIVVAALCALETNVTYAQDASLSGRTVRAANGIQIVWKQPQPQPFYYLVYRSPSGPGFPKHVDPDFNGVVRRWPDVTAKRGVSYRYRVCPVYSPDGAPSLCTNWFR